MRKLRAALALLTFLLAPTIAAAACVGEDLLPALKAEAPADVDALIARSHAVANGQGRFWLVTRPGQPDSHLFGTFHSVEAIDSLTPEIWAAFEAADRLVVELDLDQKAAMDARMVTDPGFAFDLQAPPISASLTPDQRTALAGALTTRGLSMDVADRMRPWLLASILGFPACHLQAMAEGGEALDLELAARAATRGAQVLGLETYEQAIAAFQRVDRGLLLDSIANAGAMVEGEEDVFRTNSLLYARGEIAMIAELGIYLADRANPRSGNRAIHDALMGELLDRRNRAWMQALPRLLAEGNAFVAVGALHLPGAVGLIELLRAEGYTVTRLDG